MSEQLLCPLYKQLWLQFIEKRHWSLSKVKSLSCSFTLLYPQTWYPSLFTWVLCNDKKLLKPVLSPHGSNLAIQYMCQLKTISVVVCVLCHCTRLGFIGSYKKCLHPILAWGWTPLSVITISLKKKRKCKTLNLPYIYLIVCTWTFKKHSQRDVTSSLHWSFLILHLYQQLG